MEEGGPGPSLVEHPFMLYHVLPSGMGVLLEGVLGARRVSCRDMAQVLLQDATRCAGRTQKRCPLPFALRPLPPEEVRRRPGSRFARDATDVLPPLTPHRGTGPDRPRQLIRSVGSCRKTHGHAWKKRGPIFSYALVVLRWRGTLRSGLAS